MEPDITGVDGMYSSPDMSDLEAGVEIDVVRSFRSGEGTEVRMGRRQGGKRVSTNQPIIV